MNAKVAFLAKALDQARNNKDYASGFSFMRGLLAFQIDQNADEYQVARDLIERSYGAQEAQAVDNAFIKYSHRIKND